MFIEDKKLKQNDIIDIDFENEDEKPLSPYDENINFLSEACNNEFSKKEIIVLWDKMRQTMPSIIGDGKRCYDYLQSKYNELNMKCEKSRIKNRFGYLKSMIDGE